MKIFCTIRQRVINSKECLTCIEYDECLQRPAGCRNSLLLILTALVWAVILWHII